MPWKKNANVAMYAGANWSNLIKQVSNTTPQQARRIALLDPNITFFFYCRQPMYLNPLNGNQARQFNTGDAVFFSGEPWYGSAPQCDTYQKDEMSVIYISPANAQQFQNIACYQTANGLPAIDVVSLFGGNYASDVLPYLRANNNNPPTQQPLNDNILQVLTNGSVKYLQDKGITVLLTILNGWQPVGWSEFTNQKDATDFAAYLKKDIIDLYGLDGIDIDDEYSTGAANNTSLPMITTIMRQMMPDKIISKALWSDYGPFSGSWNGHTLAQNLNYGWEMSYYGGGPDSRLSPYLGYGMNKNQLVLGFSAESRFQSQWSTVGPVSEEIVKEGYEGGMMFDFENQPASLGLMENMVNALCGPGNWNVDPNCKLQ